MEQTQYICPKIGRAPLLCNFVSLVKMVLEPPLRIVELHVKCQVS